MLRKKVFFQMILMVNSILILTGCAGLADFSIDLPGHYSIVRTSAHNVTIAPKLVIHIGELM
ncbi:putative multicopper oxidase [Solibacillus silvestris StLB046]|uniref:Multicopper oxidase n=1 Tax=Solibacillus silvestris (strain StLB046) TaxID=1002809 RepID=F2F0V9_SOLSS|nr:putative multicopper oxidase [Solibacillus silvestris StLB046]